MILGNDSIVFISHRRMFEGDESRFFLGRVIACDGTLLKVQGFTFVRDLSNGHVVKKEETRVKILSLDSPGFIVYQLPSDVSIESATIQCSDGDAILFDGPRVLMNLSERTHCGHF